MNPLPQAQVRELPTPGVEFVGIAPEVVVATGALVIVMFMALAHRWPRLREQSFAVGLVSVAAAGVFLTGAWSDVTTFGPYQTLGGMVAVDGFSVFLKVLVLASAAVGLLVARSYLRREGLSPAAYDALLLLSASGMLMMASANDLIVVFLALEVLSIALYVMAAYHRARFESQEAGLKYFVLGAFSSAVFLYGVAFVYGATGTTSLPGIARYLSDATLVSNAGLLVGMALLLVGLGFKVAAVPFHMWTPDVYEGAPTPAVTFMAAGAKVGGFAALLRVFATAFETHRIDWEPLAWALAAATLVVGSLLAIVQDDVKRMLAYSSISHAGFVLIGFQAATDEGVAAALAYLFAYTFIVLGTFAVVTVMARRGDVGHHLDDYRGLASRFPLLAGLLTVFLLAQAGIPATSGFVAKLTVFRAAVDDEQYALAILGVLVAVLAAFIYLRLLVACYMSGDEGGSGAGDRSAEGVVAATRPRVDPPTWVALAVAAGVTLAMGVAPNAFLDFAHRATLLF